MDHLVAFIGWDLRLQARHHVLGAAAFVTAVYVVIVALLPGTLPPMAVALLVFADPALLGMTLIGAMLLQEKAQGTLRAIVTSPLRPRIYLWSKIITMGALTLLSGVAISVVGYGGAVNLPPLIFGLALTALGAVLLGLNIVLRVNSVNAYMLISGLVALLLAAPALTLFELVPGALVAWIPSFASLVLLFAAAEPVNVVTEQWVTAVWILLFWNGLGWLAVDRAFLVRILNQPA